MTNKCSVCGAPIDANGKHHYGYEADCSGKTEPFTLCARTVQACIDALPADVPIDDDDVHHVCFNYGLDACRKTLRTLQPDPQREAIKAAIASERIGIFSDDLDRLTDTIMGVLK